ncbi:hypothetical protein B0I03_103210 [Flavobacterium aquaticum]|uniref:Uncharacterized protein n=1 Tax=Flavobacterium aquaticum TaxID=1236486 RepID=A0A327YRG0_9FLAO|nr:hypothetical protein [Flavobacterium aquaticum]RAK23744.1 hypothetical protein B0I03_103210 [Flavobacterium aquaticum]
MKNSLKLFALTLVGITFFSCTTDEYDVALEESVKVTENIHNAQFREGDEAAKDEEVVVVPDTLAREADGTPIVIIIRKD